MSWEKTIVQHIGNDLGALNEVAPLSNEKVEAIETSLSNGIQQLQEAHPNIKIPIVAKIDTDSLVSEIKKVISSEISKEIKSLSDEIVSKILNNIPRGPMISSRPRSTGVISDDGIPDIEIVEGKPGERPSRPKLDDMINSIIVSE